MKGAEERTQWSEPMPTCQAHGESSSELGHDEISSLPLQPEHGSLMTSDAGFSEPSPHANSQSIEFAEKIHLNDDSVHNNANILRESLSIESRHESIQERKFTGVIANKGSSGLADGFTANPSFNQVQLEQEYNGSCAGDYARLNDLRYADKMMISRRAALRPHKVKSSDAEKSSKAQEWDEMANGHPSVLSVPPRDITISSTLVQAEELCDQNEECSPVLCRTTFMRSQRLYSDSESKQNSDVGNSKIVFVDLCNEISPERSLHSENSGHSPKSDDLLDVDEVKFAVDVKELRCAGSAEFTRPSLVLSADLDGKGGIHNKSKHSRKKRKRGQQNECEVVVLDDDDEPVALEETGCPTDGINERSQVASTVIRPFSCPICLENVPRGAQACILGCGHRLCFNCAEDYIGHKVQDAQVRSTRMCARLCAEDRAHWGRARVR
jgi:hypothetical protein